MSDHKREEITEASDEKRYVGDDNAQFTEHRVDVGRSSTADRRQHAEDEAPRGQGDRADRKAARTLPARVPRRDHRRRR